MSKQKKIFKQKIKEMLSQMQKTEEPKISQPPTTPITSVTPTVIEKPSIVSSPTSIPIVKSDLKKIALLFGIMILVIILTTVMSYKTDWLLDLASKIYNWAGLGV